MYSRSIYIKCFSFSQAYLYVSLTATKVRINTFKWSYLSVSTQHCQVLIRRSFGDRPLCECSRKPARNSVGCDVQSRSSLAGALYLGREAKYDLSVWFLATISQFTREFIVLQQINTILKQLPSLCFVLGNFTAITNCLCICPWSLSLWNQQRTFLGDQRSWTDFGYGQFSLWSSALITETLAWYDPGTVFISGNTAVGKKESKFLKKTEKKLIHV